MTLQQDYAQGSMVVRGGEALSYERGTPVQSELMSLLVSASNHRHNQEPSYHPDKEKWPAPQPTGAHSAGLH